MVVVGPGWVLESVRAAGLRVDVVETRGRLDLRYIRALRALVRRHHIDLIHAHLFSPAVYASVIGAWAGVPVVATFHGESDVESGGLGRRLRYRLIDRQAVVVGVSEALAERLAEPALVRPEHIRIIQNGVDLAAFESSDGAAVRREHGIPADSVLIGALGNIRPAKDYFTLLRAAAAVAQERKVVFAVVGERTEPLYGELQALRDSLGLRDRFQFWGFRNDVPDVIDAFDLLVVSSSSEGFSLAAIQAMAAGTPVVATRSGGPEGIITDEQDGLLVPPRHPEKLAAAIARLIDDRPLADSLAGRARATVRERFSLDAMLDRYEALYAHLVDGRPAASQRPASD
jgi:glycosyltransferase involved in cell wall biosynthesis